MFLKKVSISRKMTFLYSFILFSILIVFMVVLLLWFRYLVVTNSQDGLITHMNVIETYLRKLPKVTPTAFQNLELNPNVTYSILNENQELIYLNKPAFPELGELLENRIKTMKEKKEVFEQAGNIIYSIRFEPNRSLICTSRTVHRQDGLYYLQVAKNNEDIHYFIRAFPKALFIVSILGTLVCAISGSYLSKKLLKPIKNLSQTAREITAKNLNHRIVTDGPDDTLKELGTTFNSMIERLETDFEKQRRFVSDASHELRSPLAIIHGHVNMLNRWGKDDPQVLAKSLATLKAETENMSKLIDNLLYLAKGDNNTLILKKDHFQIALLLQEVVDETLLIYSQYSIACLSDARLMVTADYNAIKQCLRILMNNSIKYSPPPGDIVIKAERDGTGTLITVEDHGTGIPAECLPYIFDRFYRADESRTKATGGTGLGLSIAKAIVESHGGTISATSNLGQGTKIAVYLPEQEESNPINSNQPTSKKNTST